jgi:hypothetical protein
LRLQLDHLARRHRVAARLHADRRVVSEIRARCEAARDCGVLADPGVGVDAVVKRIGFEAHNDAQWT